MNKVLMNDFMEGFISGIIAGFLFCMTVIVAMIVF